MKIAKPTEEDFEGVKRFLDAAEMALERAKFSLNSSEENWMELEDDDADKIKILAIRKRIADDEDISVDEVDNRVLMFEYLKRVFMSSAYTGWRRVYWASSVLLENACDPTENHLAFYQGFELNHVEREQ